MTHTMQRPRESSGASPTPDHTRGNAGRPGRIPLIVGEQSLRLIGAVIAVIGSMLIIGTVVQGTAWMVQAAPVAVVTMAAAETARRLRAPGFLIPVIAAVVCVTTLVARHASTDALWGWVPTTTALRDLRLLLRGAGESIYAQQPPAIAGPELVVLLSLSIAVLAIVIHVALMTWHSPALIGIVLLGAAAVPLTVMEAGAPVRGLIAGGAAFIAVLAIDESLRLGRWGAVITPERRRRPGSVHPAGAWRIGALALAVAVVLPLLVPGLDEPVWRTGPGSGPGSQGVGGTASGLLLDTEVSLRRDLTRGEDIEVMRVATDDPTPSYLRLAALTRFDGQAWRRPDLQEAGAQGESTASLLRLDEIPESRRYEIDVASLDNRLLPVPFPPRSITGIRGPWTYDPGTLTIWSASQSATGQQYRVEAYDVEPTAADLSQVTDARMRQEPPPVSAADATDWPEDLPAVVADTAQEVTRGAAGPYERALALQAYFRTGFTYSLDVTSDPDEPPFESFLAERVGYCEQFAATMAIMARIVGIPARVAVGFTAGTPDGQGQRIVTAHNAHAWPELWFPGHGWVRFEPTPRSEVGAAVRVPDWATAVGDPAAENPYLPRSERGAEGDQSGGTPPGAAPELDDSAAGAEGPLPGVDRWNADSVRRTIVAAIVVALMVMTFLPAAVRQTRRSRRRRVMRDGPAPDSVSAAWEELTDVVIDAGRPWRAERSPREMGDALHGLIEGADGAERARGRSRRRSPSLSSEVDGHATSDHAVVEDLVALTQQVRYAAHRPLEWSTSQRDVLADAVMSVRRALGRGRPWRARLRTALLPSSVMTLRARRAAGTADGISDPVRGLPRDDAGSAPLPVP